MDRVVFQERILPLALKKVVGKAFTDFADVLVHPTEDPVAEDGFESSCEFTGELRATRGNEELLPKSNMFSYIKPTIQAFGPKRIKEIVDKSASVSDMVG